MPSPALRPRTSPLLPLVLAPFTALLGACQSTSTDIDLERLAANHAMRLEQQKAFEAEFAEENPVPQVLQFPGHGELHLRKAQLDGRLGREEVNVQVTYVNTTGASIKRGRIVLAVFDPATGVEHSVTEDMLIPFGRDFYAHSSYTATMNAPTHGLHRLPNWEWELRVEVEKLPPPVEE